MNSLVDRIKKAFRDKEYRHGYTDEFLNACIATQIKVLREQRGWSQKDLAKQTGMAQPRICAVENVNYASWSVATLRRLAEAFDLTLCISFETFGDRIQDFELFSREYLERFSFDSDPAFLSDKGKEESRTLAEAYKGIGQGSKVTNISDWLSVREDLRTSTSIVAEQEQSVLGERKQSGSLSHGTTIR